MPELQVRPYDQEDASSWDDVVRESPTTHFMFKRSFVEYHRERFIDASVVLHEADEIVAVLPATLHDADVTCHGGLTFGSLIPRRRLGLARTVAALELCRDHFSSLGARRWTLKPLPHIYCGGAGQDDICAISHLGGKLVRRDVSTAIAPADERQLSTERRRSIKKGATSGLEVMQSSDVVGYMELLNHVLGERHGVSAVHSAAELSLLMQRFPSSISLHVARTQSGDVQAGVVTFLTAHVVHAQYIAAGEEARRAGGLDIIMETLIERSMASQRWFDFGTSNERDGSINWGLVRNKEGFGGGSVAYDRYEIAL